MCDYDQAMLTHQFIFFAYIICLAFKSFYYCTKIFLTFKIVSLFRTIIISKLLHYGDKTTIENQSKLEIDRSLVLQLFLFFNYHHHIYVNSVQINEKSDQFINILLNTLLLGVFTTSFSAKLNIHFLFQILAHLNRIEPSK